MKSLIDINVSRRAFLAGSTAVAAVPIAGFAQGAFYPYLQVKTRYDGNKLVWVQLILSKTVDGADTLAMELTPASFGSGDATLELKNLVKSKGDYVDPGQSFSLIVGNIDAFGHRTGNLDKPTGIGLTLKFASTVIQQSDNPDDPPSGNWVAGLVTDFWLNSGNRIALDLLAAGSLDTQRVLRTPLVTLLEGRDAFKLLVAPAWIQQTLAAVIGQSVSINADDTGDSANFRIWFALRKTSEGLPAQMVWRAATPLGTARQISLFGGMLGCEGVSFHWHHTRDADPEFRFTPQATVGRNNTAHFKESTFPIPGNSRGTVLSLKSKSDDPISVAVICETKAPDDTAENDDGDGEQVTRLNLYGGFAFKARTQTRTLLHADLEFEAPQANTDDEEEIDQPTNALQLRPARGSQFWRLTLTGNGRLRDTGEPVVTALGASNPSLSDDSSVAEYLPKPPTDSPRLQIPTMDFGTLQVTGPEGSTPIPEIVINFAARPLRTEEFAAQARLQSLPIWVGPDGDASTPDAIAFTNLHLPPETTRWPVLRLAGTNIGQPLVTTAQITGSLTLDAPQLDVSLMDATVSLRRARDFLVLDFRFAHIRAAWQQAQQQFTLYAEPDILPVQALDSGTPQKPTLVAEFPPQHMAEQAYLRRRTPPKGLAAIDWRSSARLMDALTPQTDNNPSFLDETDAALAQISTGDRTARYAARVRLRDQATLWDQLITDTDLDTVPKLKAELLSLQNMIVAMRDNQKQLNDALNMRLVVSKRYLSTPFPRDQLAFIGQHYADPDVLDLINDRLNTNSLEELKRQIRQELQIVEAWPPKGVAANPTIERKLATYAKRRFNKNLPRTPIDSDAGIRDRNGVLTLAQQITAQTALRESKEAVSTEYRLFGELWREGIRDLAQDIRDTLNEEDETFVSTQWAQSHPNPLIPALLEQTLTRFADPTGEFGDPDQPISRARWSGTSRLAFFWNPEGGTTPFTAENLLDWQGLEQAVQKRAQVLIERDPASGALRRRVNDRRMLEYQGIQPKPNKTAAEHMAEVYTSAARPPGRFETAIEIPFRLQLSTAQDADLIKPLPVPPEFYDAPLEPTDIAAPEEVAPGTPDIGEPVFHISVATDGLNPNLRAIWSDDYLPEALLKGLGELDLARASANTDTSGQDDQLSLLNKAFDTPPRGDAAPWRLPRVTRINGEIVLSAPERDLPDANPNEAEDRFRASMDAYDRDQIVKSSSVHGLPTIVGRTQGALELRKDAQAFEPPDGYQLIDLQTTEVTTETEETLRRDLSAIYRPQVLDFSELTLMAPGGTLNLDTSFQPPFSARRADGTSLFETMSLERWRHRAVGGRDIKVELVYRGYLFPFGHRAALIKVTERTYTQPDPATGRGPTAVLHQRFFVRVAQPRKDRWYGQPLAGRAWPCDSLEILTTETPDLTDVMAGPNRTDSDNVEISPQGRLALGKSGEGLVFWPRTSPTRAANVQFEFLMNGRGGKLSMPLIFVDNVAADSPATLAKLCEYYNGVDENQPVIWNPDKQSFDTQLRTDNERVLDHGGSPRRYAPEVSDGDSSYETRYWIIGAEGRKGQSGAETTPPDTSLLGIRNKTLGAHSNFVFGPLLVADDQPPFYPFVQHAVLRLDRVARLLGERRGKSCLAAFDANYLKLGLLDPDADTASGPGSEGDRGPKPFINILSHIELDVGRKGDRVGAVGRPSGRLVALSRREGPITLRQDSDAAESKAKYRLTPPAFSDEVNPGAFSGEQTARMYIDGLELDNVVRVQAANDLVQEVLSNLLGGEDTKLLGVFKVTEVINFALCNLQDHVPLIRETMDYADGLAADLVAVVRGLTRTLIDAVEEIEQTFDAASTDLAGKSLELRNVYPDVGSGLSRLRTALTKIEAEPDVDKVVKLLPEVPAAGKALIKALDKLARDPISPLKLELRSLFLKELEQIEQIRAAWLKIEGVFENPAAALQDAEEALMTELKDQLQSEVTAQIADFVASLSPVPQDETLADINEAVHAVCVAVLDDAVDDIIVTTGASPIKATLDNLRTHDWTSALATAVQDASPSLRDAVDGAVDANGAVIAPLRQLLDTLDQLNDTAAQVTAWRTSFDEALGDAAAGVSAQIDQIEQNVAATLTAARERLLNDLSQALFGVNTKRVLQTADTIKRDLDRLTGAGTAPPERIKAVLRILEEIDTFFFAGSYKAAATAELTDIANSGANEALKTARSIALSMLDVYESGLQITRAIANATEPPTEIADATEYLSELGKQIDAFATATAMNAIAEGLDEVGNDIDTAFAEIETALNAGGTDVNAALPQQEVKTFVSSALKAQAAFFDALSTVTDEEKANVLRLASSGLALHQPLVAGMMASARIHGRALVAYQRFEDKSSDAFDTIKTARIALNEQTTPVTALQAQITAVADTFPRAETIEMLDAWPQMLRETLALFEGIKVSYEKMLTDLSDARIGGPGNAFSAGARTALLTLRVKLEMAAVQFALDVRARVTAELETLFKASGEALLGKLQEVADTATKDERAVAAFAKAQSIIRQLKDQLARLGNDYPFFAPVTKEVGELVETLTTLPEIPELDSTVLALRNAADAGNVVAFTQAKNTLSEGAVFDPFTYFADDIYAALGISAVAIKEQADAALNDIRISATARAAKALTALENSADQAANSALHWVIAEIFKPGRIDGLDRLWGELLGNRNTILQKLRNQSSSVDIIRDVTRFLGLGDDGNGIDLRHLLVALENPNNLSDPRSAIIGKLLADNPIMPIDLLQSEKDDFALLNGQADGAEKLKVLRKTYATWSRGGGDVAVLQILNGIVDTVESVASAEVSSLVDFSKIKDTIEQEIRKLIPNKITAAMDLTVPVEGFRGIFQPIGNGTFTLNSVNTVELTDDDKPQITAQASAVLSPFQITLLGSFNALTITFSEARMDWTLGKDPSFDLEFVDYEIGPELSFIQDLASSLTASAGGAYVRPAKGMLGIEAGYGLNIPAINLGGVTFMNVGLSAFARIPFEKRKAEFGAALSSRKSPFIIIAGVWGGGGHFSLTSDGRRITTFDASFVFGGGGAVAYGPLTLQGRVSVGVFVRKIGSLTEISGDFFAGGSGKIAIFGVSASLTVTLGMDGTGAMSGSAVFRFSFSIGFAKIKFAITLFKKEGKGFENSGAEQASLSGSTPYQIAGTWVGGDGDAHTSGWDSGQAEITVSTSRQDQNYAAWSSYFSNVRPVGYADNG